MITTRIGNMLTNVIPLAEKPNVLRLVAHGTNCQGRMGSGIALPIRHTYPEAYNNYMTEHKNHGLALGGVTSAGYDDDMFFIMNCNTQNTYRGFRNSDGSIEPNGKVYVSYDAVRACFEKLNAFALGMLEYEHVHEAEIHFPLIGAGLANGDWNIIEAIIDEVVDDRISKVLWKLPE